MDLIKLMCPFHLLKLDALCIQQSCTNYQRCLCLKCPCQNNQNNHKLVLLKDLGIKLKTIYLTLPSNVGQQYRGEIDEFCEFYKRKQKFMTFRKLNGFAELLSNIDYLDECVDKQIEQYFYQYCQAKLDGHFQYQNIVQGVSISSDIQLLATSSDDGDIIIWDLTTFKFIKRLSLGNTVQKITFSKFSNILAAINSYTNNIHLWSILDLTNITVLAILEGHYSKISNFAFSDYDNYLVSSSYDKTIRIWDLNNFYAQIYQFKMDTQITSLAIWKDFVAGQNMQGFISIWNTRSKMRLFHWKANKLSGNTIKFSHNAQLLVSQGMIYMIYIWAISRKSRRQPTLIRKFNTKCYTLTGIELSQNSHFLASVLNFQNQVLIYNIIEGKETQRLDVINGNRKSMNSSVDISLNLKYIVTGGNDGFVNLYFRIY